MHVSLLFLTLRSTNGFKCTTCNESSGQVCVSSQAICQKSAEASELNAVQESSRKWPLSSGFILLTGSTATRTLAYLHIMNLNAFCSSPHLHFVTGCFSWLTVLWIFQCFLLLFAKQMFFTENKKWKNRCLNTS